MQLLFVIINSAVFAYMLAMLFLRYHYRDKLSVQERLKVMFFSNAKNDRKRKERNKGKKDSKSIPFTVKALKSLSTALSLAGIRLRAEEFLNIWAISAFLPAGICILFRADVLTALAFIIAGLVLPYVYLKKSKAKRLALFEQQLSDALMIMGNCLRTGLSFQQALNSIVNDMPEPISKEFGRVSKEIQLGVTLETALENMVERLKSKDFMLIVAAVLIQRQVGGNLSEILDGISDTIRERIKLKASIKVITATGRTSGIIVGMMPAFLMLILMLLNPAYIRSFFESQLGTIMLVVAGGLEVIGFLAVKKVVSIKY